MPTPEVEPDEGHGWVCASCGAEIEGVADRPYAYGDDDVLCFACSVARGGVYDDHYDRWVTTPDLRDLEPDPF